MFHSQKSARLRRRAVAVALLLAVAAALAGCVPLVEDGPESLSVYATVYPVYALTDGVMAGVPDVALHCLVQPQDGCLRRYRLSDWDLSLLSYGADAVVMGGRGLEDFESTLFGWGEDGPAMSALLYNLELYNQEQAAGDGETESHLKGPNPHLYMSVEGAERIVESASAVLQSLDPRYAEMYIANAEAAIGRLDALLEENRAALAEYSGRRVSLMNEALVYAAQDYGLEIGAWIDRESGNAMPDNELEPCLERLSGAEAEVVLIEKQAPGTLTDALEAAGFTVARIDIMSTHREGEGFDSYIEIQRENARAIAQAFERADDRKENP